MDYEEIIIRDVQRFRSPYVQHHYEDEPANMTTSGSDVPGSLSVGNAAAQSPSATVHHVDPALYSTVVRRCSHAHPAHGCLSL